jgi:alkylation response protein AidB-like acyl-CoA dehydrogenase
METKLPAHVRRSLPRAGAIAGLERLSGGANNETGSFDATSAGGRWPLILRRQPGPADGPAPEADRVGSGPAGPGYSRHTLSGHIDRHHRHHRRHRITEGFEEIQMRKVAGHLFGFAGARREA